MSKASKGRAGERRVNEVLESITGPHFVFHDVTLVNQTSMLTHQIDHILIHPHGLFVIETKNYSGSIDYDEIENKWTKTIRHVTTPISSPLRQNKSHATTLRKALMGPYRPIPVVVFVQNNAPYLPDENVINLNDLPLFIESYPYETEFSLSQMEAMKKAIEAAMVDVSLKEHLENISIVKKVRKESQAEMTYAIERGLCPRCDGPMEVHGYEYSCKKCGFRFKL